MRTDGEFLFVAIVVLCCVVAASVVVADARIIGLMTNANSYYVWLPFFTVLDAPSTGAKSYSKTRHSFKSIY
jgi:hypothetical protein